MTVRSRDPIPMPPAVNSCSPHKAEPRVIWNHMASHTQPPNNNIIYENMRSFEIFHKKLLKI